MKGYQSQANLVKKEKGDILADHHKRMKRWKKSLLSDCECTLPSIRIKALEFQKYTTRTDASVKLAS
jgi:hypothetical protein